MIAAKEYVNLLFEDCLIDSGKMYFCAKNYNGLFCMNLGNSEINYLGKIPESNLMTERMVIKILKVGCELYLIPMNAKNIWIYNEESQEWSSLELEHKTNNYGYMSQAVEYNSKIYMLGGFYSGIVCLDTTDKTLEYLREVYKDVEEKQAETGDCFIRSDYVQQDNIFYFASCVSNYILKFYADTAKYEWIEVGNFDNRYVGIAWDGEYFWIAPRKEGTVIKWDGEKIVEEYNYFEGEYENLFYFLGIIYDGKKIHLPGMSYDRTLAFLPHTPKNYEEEKYSYLMYKKYGEYLVSMKTNGHLIITKNDSIVFDDIINIDLREIIENYKISNLEKENAIINLGVLIDKINKNGHTENEDKKIITGEILYQAVLGEA